MDDGTQVSADRLLLALGPSTLDFLLDCGISVDVQFRRVGARVLGVRLTQEQAEKYAKVPIIESTNRGIKAVSSGQEKKRLTREGEILPAFQGIMKINVGARSSDTEGTLESGASMTT